MKRTCKRCKALIIGYIMPSCILHHKIEFKLAYNGLRCGSGTKPVFSLTKIWPVEECEKPLTWKDLNERR